MAKTPAFPYGAGPLAGGPTLAKPKPKPQPQYPPWYLTPQQQREQAVADTQTAYQPLLDYYTQRDKDAQTAAQQRAEQTRARYQALAEILKGLSPQIQGIYKEAGDTQATYAKGLGTGQAAAQSEIANQINQILGAAGSPQGQMVSPEAGQQAGNALYTLGGFIPGQTFAREGAAFGSAAAFLPASTIGRGEYAAQADLSAGEKERGQYQDEIAKLLAQQPGRVQELLREIQGQQFDYQKWATDRAYRQAQLSRDDRDFDFALAKWQEQQKTAGRKQDFDEWYKQNQVALRSESNQLRAIQNDRSFQTRLAQLGISDARLQLEAARLELDKKKGGKKGGITQNQLNKLRKVAGDLARESFQGYWALPADPNTPLSASQLRQYLKEAGTTEPADAGLKQYKRTYQESFTMMLDAGVPPSEAWKALNRYWTKPGQHMPWEMTPKGFPSGAGRPKENFNQRGQKGGRQTAASSTGVVMPLKTPTTSGSEFAVADAEGAPDSLGRRYHAAKDWFAPANSAVYSPVAGTVVEVKASGGNSGQVYGGVVKVQADNGMVFVFRHVDPRSVRVGKKVKAGGPIAVVTRWNDNPSRSHAHIEIWKSLTGGYKLENMVDPAEVFV